jgi:hypothetical protein
MWANDISPWIGMHAFSWENDVVSDTIIKYKQL